ncbi:MAG TPA: hypothetical protein VH724_19995 [Candidatus Angelobacter sp.]|jgi:hypothetical protein|nr:hypothetical protein [Candidatus Angelobacter sp.]
MTEPKNATSNGPQTEQSDKSDPFATGDWNLLSEPVSGDGGTPPVIATRPFNVDQNREETRGDLARGLLWLLTFAIGGVLVFIGLGRLEGSVLTQSVFPSLIALAGTALGFYFGSQTKNSDAVNGQSGTGQAKTE